MHSMDGCPELQLYTDPLQLARPLSSSPSGDANKSESDLDKLRISPRFAGLTLITAAGADSAESSLRPCTSAFVFWIALVGLASWVNSAIVLELLIAAKGLRFPAVFWLVQSVQRGIQSLCKAFKLAVLESQLWNWKIQNNEVWILRVWGVFCTDATQNPKKFLCLEWSLWMRHVVHRNNNWDPPTSCILLPSPL